MKKIILIFTLLLSVVALNAQIKRAGGSVSIVSSSTTPISVESTGGGTPYCTYRLGTELGVTTYKDSVSVTLSGTFPALTKDAQLVYLKYVRSGASGYYVNGQGDITLTISADTVSISGAAGDTIASGDSFEIGYNAPLDYVDYSVGYLKNLTGNPDYARYTDPGVLVTEEDLTGSYADVGGEIPMEGYNRLGLFVDIDANDSEDVDLRVLGLFESGGDTYTIDGLSVETLWSGAGSDTTFYYEFDVGTLPYVQLQAVAGTVGGTAGDLTITINKKWRD